MSVPCSVGRILGKRLLRACQDPAPRPVAARRLLLAAPWLLAVPGARAQPRATDGVERILVLGDSLSAEYGLKRGSGWVALLEQRIAQTGYRLAGGGSGAPAIVNASISGETTSGGQSRLPALLEKHRPALVVIALGANDALRGLDLGATETNLRRMAQSSREAGARVVIAGMMLPPNYGRAYGEQFAGVFPRVAQAVQAELVPFLLAGFAEDLAFFQADRIHPTEAAQPKILDNVWPAIARLGRR